jgi:site-specific recombinase XerD
MTTNVTVVFNRQKKLDSNGQGLIQFRFYNSNRRYKFETTHLRVEPKHWNDKKKCVRSSHPMSKEYNERLIDMAKCIMADGTTQRETIMHSFNEFYKLKCEGDKTICYNTMRDQLQTLRMFDGYNKHVNFSDINNVFVNEFNQYLSELKMSPNIIAKHFKNIKKYVNLAIDYNQIDVSKIGRLKIPTSFKRTKFVFLTLDEIDRIAALKCSDHMLRIQQAFLLSCYTGLRYSVVSRIDSDSFNEKKGEGLYIYLNKMQKVDMDIYLPLYKYLGGRGQKLAKKLLKNADGRLFNGISNQHTNSDLKMIANAAGINKTLTFHVGRKSFGTNLAAECGNLFTVMGYLGVSKPETAMIYVQMAGVL